MLPIWRNTLRDPHSNSGRATGKLGRTDFIIQRLPVQDIIDQEKPLDGIKLDIDSFLVKLATISFAQTMSDLMATPFKNCLKGLMV
jgi:hypothetical protein